MVGGNDMHTLEQLAATANTKAIERHESFLATLKARKGLVAILTATPLTFERDPGDLERYRAFEVAKACAERVIDRLHPMSISYVAISWAEGPGKFHVQARNTVWSGSAFVSQATLLEQWTDAEKAVAARHARYEENAGRGLALSEAGIAKAHADRAYVAEQLGETKPLADGLERVG